MVFQCGSEGGSKPSMPTDALCADATSTTPDITRASNRDLITFTSSSPHYAAAPECSRLRDDSAEFVGRRVLAVIGITAVYGRQPAPESAQCSGQTSGAIRKL